MTKRIVIGSVLKPVNDARMYEKIATSLAGIQDLAIHVAGYKAASDPASAIHLHPLFDFPRLSLSRFWAPWKFYKLLLKVKPHIILITTHELLIVTCIYRILFGGKIIYDVQENYFRNIWFGSSFPPVIRQVLALFVRAKEVLLRPLIAHYLLAERNYEKEFSFSKGKSTILENKARKPKVAPVRSRALNSPISLLYSGTIAESYGVFEAIELAKALHKVDSAITLTIIGYSSKREMLKSVREAIQPYSFIQLKGGDHLVPHQDILQEIEGSSFGLLPYRQDQSIDNCIPTKLYEYLAYRLPVLVRDNPIWTELTQQYQAGLSLDFENFHAESLLQEMKSGSFYTSEPEEEMYWESQESVLREVVISLL